MILSCPKCGKQIDSANINVAQDMAFCAPCGELHKISLLAAPPGPVTDSASVNLPELVCAKCGTSLREGAKFCDECGAPVEAPPRVKRAEFLRSGERLFTCELYSAENHAGTIPDIREEHLPETRKWLEAVYPAIVIEMKE